MELEPIETQKTPKKGVKRQGKTANDESKKHHSITSGRHRNGLTAGDARIGDCCRNNSVLAKKTEIRRLDDRRAPCAIGHAGARDYFSRRRRHWCPQQQG